MTGPVQVDPRRYRLSDVDVKMLRFLADMHHKAESALSVPVEIPFNIASDELRNSRTRLANYKLMATDLDEISADGLAYLDAIDHQPPKDYWADVIKWFRSKPWSVPFLLLLVSVPLLKGWYEFIVWLVGLFA